MTEDEKYGGKNYKPKANANKGERKQEAWTEVMIPFLSCTDVGYEYFSDKLWHTFLHMCNISI